MLLVLKPFISVTVMISFIFGLTVLKLENRKLGYKLYTLAKDEKNLREQKRRGIKQLVEMTRPQRINNLALNQGELRTADKKQLIHLTETGLAYLP